MNYDVRAKLKGAAKDGSCKGVVNYERDTVSVSELCISFNIKNYKRGVGNSLAEEHSRVFVDVRSNLLVGHFGGNKAHLNSNTLECNGKEIYRAAVD